MFWLDPEKGKHSRHFYLEGCKKSCSHSNFKKGEADQQSCRVNISISIFKTKTTKCQRVTLVSLPASCLAALSAARPYRLPFLLCVDLVPSPLLLLTELDLSAVFQPGLAECHGVANSFKPIETKDRRVKRFLLFQVVLPRLFIAPGPLNPTAGAQGRGLCVGYFSGDRAHRDECTGCCPD